MIRFFDILVYGMKIGIYSGTFDPVHSGHIAFALQAIKAAKLDQVLLMPERQPRHKDSVEHFAHRAAMITRAIKPYNKLKLLELPDKNFTVSKTLPRLNQKFPNSQFVMLMGSDTVGNLKHWPHLDQLLDQVELIVGLRDEQSGTSVLEEINKLGPRFKTTIIESQAPTASSGKVRSALRTDATVKGLLVSVRRYARMHWLYVPIDRKK